MNKFKNKEPKPRDAAGKVIVPVIKSSKVSLSFANTDKLEQLDIFIAEYRSIVSQYVDQMWGRTDIKALIDNTYKVDTWLSARMQQAAGKQASGIVRGTRKKQAKRLFIINKLNKAGEFKKARKLQKVYDEAKVSKPDIKLVNPELDSRVILCGSEGTTKDKYTKDSKGNVVVRCEDSGVNDWYFSNQDVEFEGGVCKAVLSNLEFEYTEPVKVVISFWKMIALDLDDLE